MVHDTLVGWFWLATSFSIIHLCIFIPRIGIAVKYNFQMWNSDDSQPKCISSVYTFHRWLMLFLSTHSGTTRKKPSAITMIAFPTPNPTLYIILSHYFKCSRIFALCIRSKRIKIHFVHISLFDPHKCSSLLISLWPMRNPSHVAANIVLLLFHLCPKYNFPWPTFLFEIIFVKIK